VIGAGAIGAATAWLAAESGASVAIVDRGDVAGATSSASSKLLHGGLRYLGMGDVGLVRQAHAERRANAEVVAPHLVTPLEFVVPVAEDSPVPFWKLRAGVLLYGALSRFADGRTGRISLEEAAARVPGLATDRLRGAVVYHDHQTHDGRLTLAAVLGAAAQGAIVGTHVEAVGLERRGELLRAELHDRLGGEALTVEARAVVNATGAWVDRVRRLEAPAVGTSVRLSKGAHLLLEHDGGWRAALTTPLPEGRVSFAVPWEGLLLLGTTDEPYDGDPADVGANDADEAQILREAAQSVPHELLAPERIRARFAGLRVLPLSRSSTSRARRETVVSRGPLGMVSVAGGKLTTWRAIGARAAGLALRGVGAGAVPSQPLPLPGASPLGAASRRLEQTHADLPGDVRANLAHLHGLLAGQLLAAAEREPPLLERIHPAGPDIWAQVVHARDREWAATVEDVLQRRTTVAHRGLDDDYVRAATGRILDGAAAP
jgi:glycerol-3-phosphate dehydrogenase